MQEFKLYVTGSGNISQKAIEDLKSVLEEKLKEQYTLKIINVLENPELAIKDKISATPTLVKDKPHRDVKLVGNANKDEMVIAVLGLEEKNISA